MGDWKSRGARLDGNSGGKPSTARDDFESRRTREDEKSNRRGNSLSASLTKERLEIKGRVRVRTDVSQVRRTNGDKAQYAQHNRRQRFHHERGKQSEDEQRGKEEMLRQQLRQKEEKVKERMWQKEQEQKLKEKLRMQQMMG